MKELSCRDAEFNCDYVIKADSDEEIFSKGGTCNDGSWNEAGSYCIRI